MIPLRTGTTLDRFLGPNDIVEIKAIWDSEYSPIQEKPPGGDLTNAEKSLNQQINNHRAVIERVIAQIRCWRVLLYTYRRPLASYQRVFSIVRGLIFRSHKNRNE
ncbi:transposase family protein [Rothia dentocariosa]|uniref:transposase family protein n=1 Tax=Rothia dentocariosa TaxID=2047 RepID=UPI0035CBB302